jgi:hypothetical protein
LAAVIAGLPPVGPVLLGVGLAWLGVWLWSEPHRP